MKIFVTAKPGAHQETIEKIDENNYKVSVKEPPIKGQANRAIEKALAEYFKISLFQVRIIAGHASRRKIVEISPD